MSALGCVVRSRYYDQRVESFIRLNARPVVVNVGCGLDTRFQRIAERRNAVFYELDLPEVMAIREKLLPAPAGDIVSRFPAGEVCFDVCGPMMVNTGLKPDSLRRNAAQIRSGLADGHKVERWEPRLQLIEQRSYMEFARRRWGLTGIFFRAFPHLARKFSSLLAYRISATE